MTKSVLYVSPAGTKYWKNISKMNHREDGPAVEFVNGTRWWFNNGKKHRVDGPAVEYIDGSEEWWVDDVRHREDGPAVINLGHYQMHEWFKYGKRHRLDGPAVTCSNPDVESYYIDGERVLEEEFGVSVTSFLLNCSKESAEIIVKELRT